MKAFRKSVGDDSETRDVTGVEEYTNQVGAIPVGYRVEARGLKAKPELNGTRGTVTTLDSASGRYSVMFDGGLGPFKIKPENLQKLKWQMNSKGDLCYDK